MFLENLALIGKEKEKLTSSSSNEYIIVKNNKHCPQNLYEISFYKPLIWV